MSNCAKEYPTAPKTKKFFFLNFHVTTTSTKVSECTAYGGKKTRSKKSMTLYFVIEKRRTQFINIFVVSRNQKYLCIFLYFFVAR